MAIAPTHGDVWSSRAPVNVGPQLGVCRAEIEESVRTKFREKSNSRSGLRVSHLATKIEVSSHSHTPCVTRYIEAFVLRVYR